MKKINFKYNINNTICQYGLPFFSLMFCLCLSVNAQQKNLLTIDTTKTFQTMEGFGAFNTLSSWKNISDEKKYDLVVHDLGLSIMRFELPPTFHAYKDSPYNINGSVFSGPDMQHNFKDVKALNKLGVKKFIASIWSPPAWMKTVNEDGKGPTTNKGGSLRKEAYEDFAEYCAAYCKTFKQQTGVTLYALGLQNEPEFVESYNSCVYTPSQMKEALRFVGRKFKEENISTKLYLPEVLPAQQHVADFFNAINDDKETSSYADIFAIHNYDSDGINVGGAGAREWQKYSEIATSASPPKQLWMTETSGHPNTWDGAMLLAANIYNAIQYGNTNAWLWWASSDEKSSEVFALVVAGKPTSRYYVSKHFYHFIRPGAIRVSAASPDSNVVSLAFIHSGEFKLVSILINKGNEDATISLPPMTSNLKTYLSDSTHNCILQKVGISTQLTMPGKSIATITWE